MWWLRFMAQTAAPEQLSWAMFTWAMVLLGMLVAGLVVIAIAKRRSDALKQQAAGGGGLPFTLHDLRKLHEEGELTDEQFERARQRIVAMSKAQMDKPAEGNRSPKPDSPFQSGGV